MSIITTKAPRAKRAVVRKVNHCPCYTEGVFDVSSLPLIVRWAETALLKERIDGIVACGHSGLILAGALSFITRIPVFAVRKPGERSVANAPVVTGIAPNGPAKRWAFVDDFVSSGGTFNRSRAAVKEAGLIKSLYPQCFLSYNRPDTKNDHFLDVSETDVKWVASYQLVNEPSEGYKRIRQYGYLSHDAD
jgi:hypothetical protein